MNISVFLSYPKPHLKSQKDFVNKLRKYLEQRGLQPRTLGVTDYDMEAPLTAIRRLMLESNGLITVAFRRNRIEKGSGKPDSDIGEKDYDLSGKWLTSPYCQIEPAMAFQLGLPVLILREQGVLEEGILEKGVLGMYMPEFSLSGNLNDYFKSDEWIQLIGKWEVNVRKVVENHNGWTYEVQDFPYKPIAPGVVLHYGDYTFETIDLKGHTFGQLGLFDKEHKIFFCADQVIDGIVPIVATTYPDEHLLRDYFVSLERFHHEFKDCLLLPAHGKEISDAKKVIDRIVFSYLDKVEIMHNILEHSRKARTIREIATIVYGMPHPPKDTAEFIKLKMIMSKCFSCLEYLRDEDFAVREEKDGTFYWRP